MRASRLLVLGLGIAMVAWFILGARQAQDISFATNTLTQSGPVTASEAAKASSLLSSARALNPDKEVEVLQAALAAARNDLPRARQILETVGREEPSNLAAWYLLAQVAGGDKQVEALALKHVAELHPNVRSS